MNFFVLFVFVVETSKKRWKYLRERYVQQKKQGDILGYEHLSRPYLEKMKFLDTFIQPRKTYRGLSSSYTYGSQNEDVDIPDSSKSNCSSSNMLPMNFHIPHDFLINNGTQIKEEHDLDPEENINQPPKSSSSSSTQSMMSPPPLIPFQHQHQEHHEQEEDENNCERKRELHAIPQTLGSSNDEHEETNTNTNSDDDGNREFYNNMQSFPYPTTHLNHSGGQYRPPVRTSDELLGELVTTELIKMPTERKKLVQKKILEILFFDE